MRLTRPLLAALLACLLGSGCAVEKPEQMGIEVGEEWLQVVDVHLHTGSWDNMPPGFQNRLTERIPPGFDWAMKLMVDGLLTGEGILGQLNSAGIQGGGVFAFYSPHTTGIATNEWVARQIAAAPDRLWGFAAPRLDQWNIDGPQQLLAFEKALTELPGMRGIKIAHAHQQVRFDDERIWPLYEIAGRLGKPMYLHTGGNPNGRERAEPEYSDPLYLEQAIRTFPKAVFILGHSGYDSEAQALTYTDSAIDLAARYPNVYIEPGALGARRARDVLDDYLIRVREAGVINKLIYGSDGPQFPNYVGNHLEAFVAGMERNGYSRDEMQAVLAGNFSQLFGIEIPGVETPDLRDAG